MRPSFLSEGKSMKARTTCWREYALLLLGTYMLFAPWIIGTSGDVVGSSNAWIVGGYLLTVAVLGLVIPESRPIEWLKIAIGCWLLASPLALSFEDPASSWNAWIVGALVLMSVGVVRIMLDLATLVRETVLRYRARRLSPEKIVGYESPEEPTSPERLCRQIVERSERIHQVLQEAPSDVEVEMCVFGYRACADDLVTLARLVDKELPKSGPVRRVRLQAVRRRAAGSLSRSRRVLQSGTLRLHGGDQE